MIFGTALAADLNNQPNLNEGTLLQYADDLLLGGSAKEKCTKLTIDLLNYLAMAGYRVSQKKASNSPTGNSLTGITVFGI